MKALFVSLSAIVLCLSCAKSPVQPVSDDRRLNDAQSINTVAADLVSVLSQIHKPESTTVQYIQSDAGFGRQIYTSLRSAGYGLQKVSDDRGANFLVYEETSKSGSKGSKQYRYSVKIGDVSVERTYRPLTKSEADSGTGSNVYPTTPMILRGSRKPVSLNTDLFEMQDEDIAFLSQIDYRVSDNPTARVPRATFITDELISEIASSTAALPGEVGLNASKLEIKNVFFTNESNFTSLTQSYQPVTRDVVIFDNDSLRLGVDGKKMIRQIHANFNSDTDIITLLGCSNGYTKLEIGNEGLALGRSSRVLEELLTLGVPRSSVLDEGCWAPASLPGRYPARGVVVELKRRKA